MTLEARTNIEIRRVVQRYFAWNSSLVPKSEVGVSSLGGANNAGVQFPCVRTDPKSAPPLRFSELKNGSAPIIAPPGRVIGERSSPPETQSNAGMKHKGVRGLIGRRPLLFYFLLAYAITWIVMVPYTLSSWGVISGDWGAAFILHTFGPAFAAVIVTGAIEGKEGLRDLKDRIRHWRVGWRWLLFIFAVIPALLMAGVVIQPGAFTGFLGVSALDAVRYPLYYFGIWWGGGPFGEEIGWRGFALPRMQPRYGPLSGTLMLGVLWAFWHIEDFLTPAQGGGPGTGWATFFANFSIFVLLVLSLAVILTWIFNHTKGSVFAAISAHASVDTPQLALISLFPAVGVTSLNLAALIGFGIPALLIVLLTHGRLGYRPG